MSKINILLLYLAVIFLVGCSAQNEEKAMKTEESDYSNDVGQVGDEQKIESLDNNAEEMTNTSLPQRKIIHKAFISADVQSLTEAQAKITEKVNKFNGYIVESFSSQESESRSHGRMVVRVPEEHFEKFLSEAEGQVTNMLEKNITGEDVTEQFVDLESRLKSKKAVETRLLVFMDSAEKTEDLLKISSDLAKVQEEIEVIVGKMKYLENQTSFSTIELNFYEDAAPSIDNKELNTLEKTKKQFINSVNGLLKVGSGIIVFFIGNLPILLVLGIISFVGIWFFRKKRNK